MYKLLPVLVLLVLGGVVTYAVTNPNANFNPLGKAAGTIYRPTPDPYGYYTCGGDGHSILKCHKVNGKLIGCTKYGNCSGHCGASGGSAFCGE